MGEKIAITASALPSDPRVCAFTLDRVLLKGSALCLSQEEAKGSPLFEQLFALPGVTQVWVAGNRVTVACQDPQKWETAARPMADAIRGALGHEQPLAPRYGIPPSGDLAERVRAVINSEVNPGLAQHGGRAELVDIVDGEARVRLTGGCQGCGAAKMTLSYGIEQTLRTKIPELRGVKDITDHAQGENPFYASATSGRTPFPPQ